MHYQWRIMVRYYEYLKNRLGQKFNNKFWEELFTYVSLIQHRPYRKQRVQ
jgi:hypothetical protein